MSYNPLVDPHSLRESRQATEWLVRTIHRFRFEGLFPKGEHLRPSVCLHSEEKKIFSVQF